MLPDIKFTWSITEYIIPSAVISTIRECSGIKYFLRYFLKKYNFKNNSSMSEIYSSYIGTPSESTSPVSFNKSKTIGTSTAKYLLTFSLFNVTFSKSSFNLKSEYPKNLKAFINALYDPIYGKIS